MDNIGYVPHAFDGRQECQRSPSNIMMVSANTYDAEIRSRGKVLHKVHQMKIGHTRNQNRKRTSKRQPNGTPARIPKIIQNTLFERCPDCFSI